MPCRGQKHDRPARIVGPADVPAVEVFGVRTWQPAMSSDGVAVEVSRLRARAPVDGPHG
jgi:hypothetical protein